MSLATREAIYQALNAEPTVVALLSDPAAIYYGAAPAEARHPFIVLQLSSGTPTYVHGTSAPAFENELWTIRATDRSSSSTTVEMISERVATALTDLDISISGYSPMYLKRESDVPSYVETYEGQEYRHAGAMFRLMYQQ